MTFFFFFFGEMMLVVPCCLGAGFGCSAAVPGGGGAAAPVPLQEEVWCHGTSCIPAALCDRIPSHSGGRAWRSAGFSFALGAHA